MEPPAYSYSMPAGVHAIPSSELDLRSDAEIDAILLHPPPVKSEKNIWFFWHSGYANMHPYAQRTVRAYHRRFAPKGWTIRVLDLASPNSPGNVANFLDVNDPQLFPAAFRNGTMTGTYARQHTSDLVRFPLLLAYGGVYADVGLMPVGDLDALWETTVGSSSLHPTTHKRYEVISYQAGVDGEPDLTNYFLAARKENALFTRCHALFLALWAEDGGRCSTDGMHRSSLLRGLPLPGKAFSPDVQVALFDYIAQGQVVRMVMGTVDEQDGWDGPRYIRDHVYVMDYMSGSQLINDLTAWDGTRAFNLMSLRVPGPGETESDDQKAARDIVEACLSRSFAFKLAHGLIIAVLGETLGSLWRSHPGSDIVPGTYAHWLRYGMVHWTPDVLPQPVEFRMVTTYKNGPLLE
ncbi:hypothetical protein BD289DRAFT_405335 [Coniella lustricola]|uniref:Capsule polysaccharide biosynthesis protein n=1 Tax=Coniella lustricola TaxID=2025994 RepID=A0A2T3AEA2_9PEZI|nr:hypothetical protein BD289DRAFT_405335 [Coniella lustricola]